jgi:hypothetical protein
MAGRHVHGAEPIHQRRRNGRPRSREASSPTQQDSGHRIRCSWAPTAGELRRCECDDRLGSKLSADEAVAQLSRDMAITSPHASIKGRPNQLAAPLHDDNRRGKHGTRHSTTCELELHQSTPQTRPRCGAGRMSRDSCATASPFESVLPDRASHSRASIRGQNLPASASPAQLSPCRQRIRWPESCCAETKPRVIERGRSARAGDRFCTMNMTTPSPRSAEIRR